MSLPNVNITLGNGNMGTVNLSDDGVAGLIVTGTAVEGKLELNKPYVLSSLLDLKTLGIEKETNPLAYKDVAAFYMSAGEGAELHLMVVEETTTLSTICVPTPTYPLGTLIDSAAGRIRLVGINRNPPADYTSTIKNGLDSDVCSAIGAAQYGAETYMSQIAPFRLFLPALGWNGETKDLFQPCEQTANRVAMVMASDGLVGESKLYSAAIGQVLGRAAKTGVHQSLGRVRDGAIAASGFLTDGKTPEEHFSHWNILDDAGYIFYRTFVGKNGYFLNGDPMATAASDDYHTLSYGRIIDKAAVIAYRVYIDEILDNIAVDGEKGSIPTPVCKSFEASIIRAVGTEMAGEISSFTAYVDPEQNVLRNGKMEISCKIVPLATLREINVNLSLTNPAL